MNLRTFVIGDFGMQCLDDFRLSFKGREFLPLMVGGMGTNISTANLVLAIDVNFQRFSTPYPEVA